MQKVPSAGSTSASRGRPRAFDRDDALLAAMRVFWAHGFSATSIADLTEAMGIGSPSLYAAFGSKEALYAEAIRAYGDRYGARVWNGFHAAASARGALEAFLTDSATAFPATGTRDPPGCMVTLSAVESEGCAALGALVRRFRADALATIEARLARAVEDGELAGDLDLAAIARFFLAVQGGLSLQARDGATRAELTAAARAAMSGWDALVAGIDVNPMSPRPS